MEPEEKKTRNMLKQGEVVRFWDWIKNNQLTIIGTTDQEIAARATAELGFAITGNNVAAALIKLGFRTPRKRGEPIRTKDPLVILAREIVELVRKTGINPSEDLMAIARGSRVQQGMELNQGENA